MTRCTPIDLQHTNNHAGYAARTYLYFMWLARCISKAITHVEEADPPAGEGTDVPPVPPSPAKQLESLSVGSGTLRLVITMR